MIAQRVRTKQRQIFRKSRESSRITTFRRRERVKMIFKDPMCLTTNENKASDRLGSNRLHQIGFVPIVLIAIVYSLYLIFGVGEIRLSNSPVLLLALDTLFLTGTGLVVAIISVRSYLTEGSPTHLLLGMATTVSGFTALLAGLFVNISVNDYSATFNLGFLFSGSLQFLAAMISLVGTVSIERSFRKATTIGGYVVVLVIVTIVSALVFFGYAPVFFTPLGPTLTRHWVLGSATSLFASSSLLFAWQYYRTKSEVLYWYSMGLALLTIGLFGSSAYTVPNGIFDWTSRLAQYLGGFYFLAAVITSGRMKGAVVANYYNWAEAFRSDRRQIAAFFSNLSEAFVYGRIITNEDGKPVDWYYLDVNEAYLRITRLRKADVIGKRATDVFPSIYEDPGDWITLYGSVALTGKQVTVERYAKVTDKWYYVSSYSPQIGYFIALFDDITQRVKTGEALQKAQSKLQEYADSLEHLVEERTKELQQAERMAAIGQVAGMVEHDIRNPLQTINSELYLARQAIEGILEDNKKQDALESVNMIQEQVNYIEKIVSDLQDYVKTLKPELVDVDICQFIPQTLKTIAKPSNIQASIVCEEDMPKLKLDTTFMRRILTNLINNGIQAMPNGGKLIISASRAKDIAVLTVSDSGVGIPDDLKTKLFTPLFTTKAKGQGFGLPIVKRLVEALNGTITFESQEGKGTKFIIQLPLNSMSSKSKVT